ncbi:MAG: M20/M25/M40 family metallo-hydrolase, partial [Anaerolineae bacterium]
TSRRSTFNIGLVEGGTSINTRASHASLSMDLRATRPDRLTAMEEQVMAVLQDATSEEHGLHVETTVVGSRPSAALNDHHPLVQAAQESLRHVGYKPSNPEIGSTDANITLAAHIPSVCIGITVGGDAHTTNEYILVDPIRAGMQQLTLLTLYAAEHINTLCEWY